MSFTDTQLLEELDTDSNNVEPERHPIIPAGTPDQQLPGPAPLDPGLIPGDTGISDATGLLPQIGFGSDIIDRDQGLSEGKDKIKTKGSNQFLFDFLIKIQSCFE